MASASIAASVSASVSASTSTSASPSAVANDEPPFPSRLVERSVPSMQLRTPLFSFPDDAANVALEAVFEKKAAEEEQSFLEAYRSPKAAGSSGGYLRFTCAPTIVRPRLASVACSGAWEIVGFTVSLVNEGATFAVDGKKVRAMKAREFFLPEKPGVEGFSVRATAALQGIVDACGGWTKLDTKNVDARITGFTVDDKGMTLVSTKLGCSAGGFEARMLWDDVKEVIDPKGGIARVRE